MKRISSLIILGAVGVLLMYGMYVIAAKMNDRKNNFIRLVPPHAMGFIKRIELGVNSYYYSGNNSDCIYLANRTAFDYVLMLNLKTLDTSHIMLSLPYFNGVDYEHLYTQVYKENVFLLDAVNRNIILGNINTCRYWRQIIPFTFGPGVFLNDSVFIYQSYDNKKKIQYLNKWICREKGVKQVSIPLGENQEGFFPTDGMSYVFSDASLIYLYRYKNKVIQLDTALNIIKSFNTIDTNTFAKVSADYIKSQHKLSMTAPPLTINNAGAVDGNLLYVKSPLIADNEVKRNIKDNDPIDIYELRTGKYLYSIYLPRENGKTARNFIVTKGMLIAFYESSILLFKLNGAQKY